MQYNVRLSYVRLLSSSQQPLDCRFGSAEMKEPDSSHKIYVYFSSQGCSYKKTRRLPTETKAKPPWRHYLISQQQTNSAEKLPETGRKLPQKTPLAKTDVRFVRMKVSIVSVTTTKIFAG